MKKFLALAVLLIAFATSYSQVKISQMPRYTGNSDALLIPVVNGSSNFAMTGLDFVNNSSGKYDSILMASVKRLKDTANALRVTINAKTFYDSSLMASTKRLKDTANAIRISLNAKTFYDSVLMASVKRLKDTAAAIRGSFGNISTTFLGKNFTTGQDSSTAGVLFKTVNGASPVQLHPITFNFRAVDTTATSAFYFPLVFNGLATSRGNFSIKSETNRLVGQTGPDDVLSIGYGIDGGTLLDSNRYIRIGIESNFRQPGQPDSARQFEFHIPEIGYTSPSNVSSVYRPGSWIGSRTHPAGSWIFHADSYAFAFAGNDNVRLSADDNNIIAQTAGDGHFKFLNAGTAAGLDLQLTGAGTSLSINNPSTINYTGTFSAAAVLAGNYYPASGNTIQLNSFTNDLFVKAYTNQFTEEMSQNTGEWSWNLPSSGGYFYKWMFGGAAKLTMTPTATTWASPVTFLTPTSSLTSINLPSGVKKTSMADGDLLHSSGHLYFHDGSTDYDLVDPIINNYWNKGFPFNNYSFAYGTSITFGFAANDNYYNIIQREFGNSTFTNYAISSTALRTACRQLATNQGTKLIGASIGDPAFNNSRWGFGTAGLDTTHLFQLVKAGSRWLTAFQFTDTLQFYRVAAGTVNPNVTTSQSALAALALDTLKDLGSRSLFFATNSWWKQSIVANETYHNTNVKGTNLIIGVWADSIGGSRIQVTVDGTVVTTYDPNNRTVGLDFDAPTGFHRLALINDVIVLTGLKDTLHDVILTFLDGGKFGGVDFIGNMKIPSQASFAPIYVIDMQHMNAAGYALTGGSTQVQDSASNSRWADQVATFPGYVAAGAIVRVNVNFPIGHFNPLDVTQISQVDGVHPLGPGYRNMAIDIIATINPKAIPQNSSVSPSFANGTILFANGSGGIFGSSNFTFDGIHLTIGNNGTATDDIGVRHDQGGFTAIRSWNGSSSSGAQAGIQCVNDGLLAFGIRIRGSNSGVAYGDYINNSGIIYSGGGTTGATWMQDNNTYIALAVGNQAPANTLMKLFGPSGNIQTGTNPADIASAIFGITSTTKGFLPPRMTNAQANAISSPATGLMVYCTDCTAIDASTGVIEVWNGSVFKKAW